MSGIGRSVVIHTTEVVEVDDALIAAFARLTPQLSSSSPPPGHDELSEIVANPSTVLFIAREIASGEIVGTLTLALFRIPTGLRAWVEDVVVDQNARGKGVGAALSEAALARARREGARTIDLTSRPTRDAANRLYKRIGFVQRDTNVYRYDLTAE
jgi:ribosomal protein S18 acetylase RimI-like enzyme